MHIIMSTIYGTQRDEGQPAGPRLATLWAAFTRRLTIILDTLATWQERASQRYRLAELDDRMLRDVGLSRADIRREVERPFWRSQSGGPSLAVPVWRS